MNYKGDFMKIKNIILKASFILSAVVSILSAFTMGTDGYEFKGFCVSMLCLGYCAFFGWNNLGKWIFR